MIEIRGNKSDPGRPLKHFWSTSVGAGRANEGLRARWQQQLRQAIAACGFRYIPFHGLFHDNMFVYRQEPGGPIYNFQYIDDLFDALLEMRIRPFVELGFVLVILQPRKRPSSGGRAMAHRRTTMPSGQNS